MARSPDHSADSQFPWLPDERFELALDARTGMMSTPVAGANVLTVTTDRAIKLGRETGKVTTSMVPLDRLTGVEVIDAARPSERLAQGLTVFAIGVILGLVSNFIVPNVSLIPLLVGGLPILISIYMLAGYAFPDTQGELVLHTGSYSLHQPLLTAEARRDAYLAAHRVYELMAMARTPQPPLVKQAGMAASPGRPREPQPDRRQEPESRTPPPWAPRAASDSSPFQEPGRERVAPPAPQPSPAPPDEPRPAPRPEPQPRWSATWPPRNDPESGSPQEPLRARVAPPAPQPAPAPPDQPDEPRPAPPPEPQPRWSQSWAKPEEPDRVRVPEYEPQRASGHVQPYEGPMAVEEEQRGEQAPPGERVIEEASDDEGANPRQE